ncbi:MAG: hypothetical protein FWG30_09270 [Eubacteriaceae bacterium]|nr:hypothetical protein [Eubacteriaceae bacterium]
MPVIKVYSQSIEPELKAVIAKKLSAEAEAHLQVSTVQVIFIDLDRIYGKDEREHCLLEMEGPAKTPEVIESLGKALCSVFLQESGRSRCNVSAVYHENRPDLVITLEGSLENRRKSRNSG